MNTWLFALPFLSAIIVKICVYLAGRLLFSSILPKKKDELANRIADAVSSGFSLENLRQKLTDPGAVKNVMPVVEEHIDNFLRYKLKEKMPMIGMLIGDKTVNSLKEVFLKEIEELFPAVLSKFSENLQKEIDLRQMVHQKLSAIPVTNIQKAFSPIQRYYEYAGMVGGFIAGVVALLVGVVVG